MSGHHFHGYGPKMLSITLKNISKCLVVKGKQVDFVGEKSAEPNIFKDLACEPFCNESYK